MKRLMKGLLAGLMLLLPLPALAQNIVPAGVSVLSRPGGTFYATNFGTWHSTIISGNTTTGSGTSIIVTAPTSLSDGSLPAPNLILNGTLLNPIYVADNNAETVTPTSISFAPCPGGNIGIGGTNQCATITGTFNSTHGPSAFVQSGSFGLDEAISVAAASGGGTVVVDQAWVLNGGLDSTISGLTTPYSNVTVLDLTGPLPEYWTVQPTTLTALATPATRSATAGNTQVISGTATGTWAASAYFVCVTYVDELGGESPCSASFSFTATASVALNYASPAASTGAVGWRAYAGLTGTSTEYQLPITSANCTLTTLEFVYPACAIGSAGVFTTPTTATSLIPGYVVNTYQKNTQSHTTFGYQPSTRVSTCSPQWNYGPFTATSGGTTTQKQVLATVPLESGCLNYIGRTIRVTAKIAMTNGTSETPQYLVQLGPSYTTGTPTNICVLTDTTALTAAANSTTVSCTMTTNATGATGTVAANAFSLTQLQAGTTAGASAVDSGTAAVTGENLTGNNNLYITYIGSGGTSTAAQVLQLSIEDL